MAPPDDPYFGEQWYLANPGGQLAYDAPVGRPGVDVGALAAGERSRGAGAPPVAIIDTGVVLGHEDLRGAAWANPGEVAGNGVDDDANGYVDDVHGWNTDAESPDVSDGYGHGTGVAGVLAARTNNGIGIAGLAPETKLMVLRTSDDEGYMAMADVAEALHYAADNGARVANLSIATNAPISRQILQAAIESVPDLLIVAGAGNSSADNDLDPWLPCASPSPNVVCVTGTDAADEMPSWAHVGATSVDLAAPAVHIRTLGRFDRYGIASGTSLSTPLTAAVAQLLLGRDPRLSTARLRNLLISSGKPVDGLRGAVASARRLDAAAALAGLLGPLPVDTPSEPPAPPTPHPGGATAAERPVTVSTPWAPDAGPAPTAALVHAPAPPAGLTRSATPRRSKPAPRRACRKQSRRRRAALRRRGSAAKRRCARVRKSRRG